MSTGSAAGEDGNSTITNEVPVLRDYYGSLSRPEVFEFNEAYEGRYADGYFVYNLPKMIKETRGYPGLFIMRNAHPTCVDQCSATIVTQEYLNSLATNNWITEEQNRECNGILLKNPQVEAGDAVGTSQNPVKPTFPCTETRDRVKQKQAEIPKEAMHCVLLLVRRNLDNRIFSIHDDFKIDPYLSVPDSVEVAELGGEKVTHWHAMFRVAYSGASFPLGREGDQPMNELIDRFKKANSSGVA
jgi:hypothetical protein